MGKVLKDNKKRSMLVLLIIIIIFLGSLLVFTYKLLEKKKTELLVEEIKSHYSEYVKTNKEAILYTSDGKEQGLIGKNIELSLNKISISKETKLYNIENFDNKYYIKYEDVDKIDKLSIKNDRYKKYIPFNENIITKDITNFYNENEELVYKFSKSFNLPIVIKEENKYGIEFNNELLYVNKDDIVEIKENHNTDLHNASGVAVLNYHAFYDENNDEERRNCNTPICHSKSQFKTHLDYFKENNILTLKMQELEMYIDGKIQLPKSVLITIDDGGREEHAIEMLTEYQMYGTIFLITSWFDPKEYYHTEYIELHSHSDNLHNQGDCPTGQGGGIQCLSEEVIQNDLKTSREKLDGSTYFCYPFYEYNAYSERMLKEAGFTMAFIGWSARSDNLAHVDMDKFKIRRFVIVTETTMKDLNTYFNQIK